MALIIRHAFVNAKADGPDPTIVQPSNWNADHQITGSGQLLPGMLIDFVGFTWPSYLLECYGQSISATTYAALFAAMVKQATVTFTLGTPGVVNWASHGIPVNGKFRFKTTGTPPTGVPQNTDFYVLATGYTSNSFRIALTPNGAALTFDTVSGTLTGIHSQFGVATDLSTFTVPDLRGRVAAGLDTMGGTAANRLVGVVGGVSGGVLGAVGGEEAHVTIASEMAAHTHAIDPPSTAVAVTVDSGGAHTHTVTGTISTAPDHTHPDDFAISGTIAAGAGHLHQISYSASAGSGNSVMRGVAPAGTYPGQTEAAHTHPFTGTITGSVGAGGTHGHTFSSGVAASGGAHVHTASGTVDIASFTSGSAGTGTGHNNTQPTMIVRKLLFTG